VKASGASRRRGWRGQGWGPGGGLLWLGAVLLTCPGCTWLSYFGTSDQGQERGKIWFVGGAGGIGNVVGTFDVPRGLKAAGYKGAIETFGWQSVVGGTLRDQMDRDRNEQEARRLAARIEDYMNQHPGRPVSIIALSAGTGIAAWALEALPPQRRVRTVVFLSSSLSRQFDLSPALGHVEDRLHVFYSDRDPVLAYLMPVAGSVDREWFSQSAIGLYGVALPTGSNAAAARELYKQRVRNHAYQDAYAKYGYFGMHADSTAAGFIEHVVAPLVLRPMQAGGDLPETQVEADSHRQGAESAKSAAGTTVKPER
jgi:pimeloyl-ACP methyl ester carboxylesterase